MAAHSMYFPSLFQLGSPLILVTAPELCRVIVSLSPTANAEFWAVEAFSLCVFTSTKSPRGPPWNEGHRPKVRHETSVFEVPVQEQHEHSFFSSSTNTFITGSLYTVRGVSHITRRSRPLGKVGLAPRQYTEWNVVGCARSTGDPSQQGLLPEVYRTASTGRCAHLLDRVLTSQRTINKEPTTPCPGGICSW